MKYIFVVNVYRDMALFGWYGSGGIWIVWRNSGGICERKILFRMKKKSGSSQV